MDFEHRIAVLFPKLQFTSLCADEDGRQREALAIQLEKHFRNFENGNGQEQGSDDNSVINNYLQNVIVS